MLGFAAKLTKSKAADAKNNTLDEKCICLVVACYDFRRANEKTNDIKCEIEFFSFAARSISVIKKTSVCECGRVVFGKPGID